MKTAALREVKEQLSNFVARAQHDKVLITKHGRPAAILWGVEGLDFEDIVYMTNPDFWKMIRKRRASRTIPWERAKRRLLR